MTTNTAIGTQDNDDLNPNRRAGPPTWKEENDVIGIEEFFGFWPTEASALEWYENHRWRDGLRCPRCGGTGCYKVASGKPLSHRCRECKKYFSVKIGTPMEHSNLSVRKFLLYIHFMLTESKGSSGRKMHASLKTGLRTAWFLGQRVRRMAKDTELPLLSGLVQIDETYFGGKFKNMPKKRRKKYGGDGMANKIAIIGAIDEYGNVAVEQLLKNTNVARLDFVMTNVKPGSIVVTDGHPGYSRLSEFGYIHKVVIHEDGQYVDEEGFTTNAIEGHWSQLKRKYHGVHHYLPAKNAQRYLDESTFRNNLGPGNGPKTIGLLLDMAEGRTLPWKELVNSKPAVWDRR
ncbi:MAG: IS1595 family transposase [Chloroflexi bacterium]|nr:IS1595 family transposase [Chloroflexota bacterium]